jgi:gamma-glutamyltranspeptidase
MTDLERYYAVERPAVGTAYRGHQIYSSAPPSGGGATLAAQLNLLERFDRPANYAEHAPTLHAMIEAWKLVPSGRGRIADPGLWPVTTEPYTSKDTARVRWQCFDPDRALEPDDLQGEDLPCARELRTSLQDLPDACEGLRSASPSGACHAAGTTSFAVADAEGSLVAVTQTLGTWGGNFYVTPGLGFLYNDKLGSYASDPASYGARLPNARHGSSLAPTIVLRTNGDRVEPVLAAGAAGNEWITSAVYSVVAGVIDARLGPQEALELPRFHVSRRQRQSETVYVVRAERSLAPAVVRRLESLGHKVEFISLMGELRMGYGAAVTVGRGRVTAGADPRRSGAAGAVP